MSDAEQMARLTARKIEQTRVKQARMSRRDFLQRAMMLAGAGVCGPLWSAMKYDRDAVLDLFRLKAQATDARVNAGIEENPRAGFAPALFGEAFRIADDSCTAAKGGWMAFGSEEDLAAWLDAEKCKDASGLPGKAKYYLINDELSIFADAKNIVLDVN